LLLQITADVTGRPVAAARVPDASAIGAAIYAVAAAEGAADMTGVVNRMGNAERTLYRPGEPARRVYDALYRDYVEVARHFGEGGTDVMTRLHRLRRGLV
ncbi:MAG TPA: ribulokinase, partial [bacterium]|nr:ribulokinase [bacterium]